MGIRPASGELDTERVLLEYQAHLLDRSGGPYWRSGGWVDLE